MNVETITINLQSHKGLRSLSQIEVNKKKPFLLTENYYDSINDRISRRDEIEHI